MSFSVNRSKIEPKKPSKKIGNLFSDAWKKGNEFDAKVRLLLAFQANLTSIILNEVNIVE